MTLKEKILSVAKSAGADLAGVAKVRVYSDYLEAVSARLKETGASDRDYMISKGDRTFPELSDVRPLLPSAKSLILLGVYCFDTEGDYRATRRKLQGKTARTYAYYPVVRQIAEQVAASIEQDGYQVIQGQHIPLKHAANEMKLGTYGWNGLLFTRDFGSYVALRAVITDAELEPDAFDPPKVSCEDCGRCLKACPTGALFAPYKVNPVLCINPLGRKEAPIPRALREKMGNWVRGCDICQEVCPINRALKQREPDPRAGFDPQRHASHRHLEGLRRRPDLKRLIEDDQALTMRRNAIVALANIGSDAAMDILQRHSHAGPKELADYFEWAVERATRKTGKRDVADTTDA